MANVAADRLTVEMGNRRRRGRMNHSMYRDATWTATDWRAPFALVAYVGFRPGLLLA